ncbi:Uncharacterised protein [Mycobacteroides abscessus]|nr:Uncharacterised protein [Mycobacteroides abscessus]SIN02859.1 Uncharacterised protein [Mycobacteroides abscessus subsp. abscessus]
MTLVSAAWVSRRRATTTQPANAAVTAPRPARAAIAGRVSAKGPAGPGITVKMAPAGTVRAGTVTVKVAIESGGTLSCWTRTTPV